MKRTISRKRKVKQIEKSEFVEVNGMQIEYQKLSKNELDVFIEMRINQLREEGSNEDVDLKPALMDYYMRHMKDDTFISWIDLDEDLQIKVKP